jgi:predicted phage terminase large subunit-like protein
MVSAAVFKDGRGGRRIYILPHPVNRKMDFPTSLDCARSVSRSVIPNKGTELVVESVAFQAAYVQELKRQGYRVHPYEVRGRDKRTRLAFTSAHVQSGTVLFPKAGVKELMGQLVNFNIEKHDDLADAFSMCVDYAMTRKYVTFAIYPLGR